MKKNMEENMNVANKLFVKTVEAQYDYFQCLEEIYSQRYIEETKDLVPDFTHWAYSTYFGKEKTKENEDEKKSEKSKELKDIYKALSLLCHPDKCTDERAAKTFATISNLYEQENIELLSILLQNADANRIHDIIDIVPKIQYNEKCQRMFWYLWFIRKDTVLRELFVDKNFLIKKTNILELENKLLREELENTKLKLENEMLKAEEARLLNEIKKYG